ncbi:hypothetical protein MIDIC_490014 [Alphaproteobacteria bacterium]
MLPFIGFFKQISYLHLIAQYIIHSLALLRVYKERGYAKKGQKIHDFISGRRYSKENFIARL